jgi:hypothetical protein
MEHPLENGAVITDHRIILPTEIELSVTLKAETYKDTYKAIKYYYLTATLLNVQTKTGLYENQIISSMPHEESAQQYDTVSITINLRQALFSFPDTGISPENPEDNNTVERGQLSLSPATATQIALAIGVFNSYKRLSR